MAGHTVIHWSAIGDPRAPDHILLSWACDHGYVVFTHDLDFGAILAATGGKAPSVIQLRTQDVSPESRGTMLVGVLDRFSDELTRGALISVDEHRARARVLPLK